MTTTTTFKPGTARWLSANGHPGYSADFARKVWAVMSNNFDEVDIATCSTARYSGMIWTSVRWVRDGWTIPTEVAQ